MRAVLAFGIAAVAFAPMKATAPPLVNVDVDAAFARAPVVVRRELNASSDGADRKWVRAVRDLVEDRLDVDALAPGTPVTVWTVDDDVVAFAVEQHFAARAADKDGALRWVFDDGSSVDGPFLSRPVRYAAVASRVGVREHPVTHRIRFHAGTDYAAVIGTPVRAAGDGVIVKWVRSWTGGKILVLKHDDGFETKYMHLDDKAPGIDEGVRVHEGQLIAFVGKTGRVTGPHLHFELRDRWGTLHDSVVERYPAADRATDASLAELQMRRDLLLTFNADGSRDLASPLTQTPSEMETLPPMDDDDVSVVPPIVPVRKTELRARGGPRRRRLRVMVPVFDDVDAAHKDGLTRRAILLAAEFPDDPLPS